jgi:hypothetical protein
MTTKTNVQAARDPGTASLSRVTEEVGKMKTQTNVTAGPRVRG